MKVMVETSAHHVHVSEADLEALFGRALPSPTRRTCPSPVSSPARRRWKWSAPKGSMKMSILGPTRPETQVEISLTDARKLGVTAPHPGVRRPGGHPPAAPCGAPLGK